MVQVRAKARSKPASGMNKLEARYARELALWQRAGDIAWWGYEPLRFRLGDGAWFTPDFIVVRATGAIEAHETKGFMREAARVRLQVAATLYPWLAFIVLYPNGGAGWRREEIAVGPGVKG